MRNIALVMALLGWSLAATSQVSGEGTFQLMSTNLKVSEVFTTEIFDLIENHRKLDQVAIVQVGDFTWVRILSHNTINDPSFTLLPEGIIEIDPNDPLITSPDSPILHK
ncbi:MAG: hypothetical protein ACI837_001826 [Crocinitomicaceae bacterium]|jgi:hypothetical protein